MCLRWSCRSSALRVQLFSSLRALRGSADPRISANSADAPDAEISDGLLDVLAVEPWTTMEVVTEAVKLYAGHPTPDGPIPVRRSSEIGEPGCRAALRP